MAQEHVLAETYSMLHERVSVLSEKYNGMSVQIIKAVRLKQNVFQWC